MTRRPVARVAVARREPLRVEDVLLKCIGFVAEVASGDVDNPNYDIWATGLFVGIESKSQVRATHVYFVTAKHVALRVKDRGAAVLANGANGMRMAICRDVYDWEFSSDTDLAAISVNSTWSGSQPDSMPDVLS